MPITNVELFLKHFASLEYLLSMKKTKTAPNPKSAPSVVPVGSIPEGKVLDFLTNRYFEDTAEEYVRQNIEKALVRQYRYPATDCEPEFKINMGSNKPRVDIAIFESGTRHEQENIYIIIETKKPGTNRQDKKDGIGQLQSYMAACPNVKFGMWTNGDDRVCFATRKTKSAISCQEIPDLPSFGQSEADAARPHRKDLVPATADNLLFAFRRCHNYIAGSEGMQKAEAFWELLKIIFCKIEDERSKDLEFFVTPSELNSATAAAPAKIRISKLFSDKVVGKYPAIFDTADRTVKLKANVLAYVVAQLQKYSLLSSPVDVKGVAYEEIVGSNLRGDRGEFFTPRNACRMAVAMLQPTVEDKLLDPCCGTGGFLITAMNYALKSLEESEPQLWRNPDKPTNAELQELFRHKSEFLQSRVFGLDLNPALVRAAKMNMVMNNDGEGGLFQLNSLSNPHTWPRDAAKTVQMNSIDLIFTNPPFGANIVIDDHDVLAQYELASVWDNKDKDGFWIQRKDKSGNSVLQKSLPPEILFIERCLQFLKPGTGRMAMVIPNGILNNPALGYVRQWILKNAQVLAVVDMCRDLFQPKNDTQTSMVLMRKLSDSEKKQAANKGLEYPIFMAVAEKIGHDKRGNVQFKRDKTGQEIVVKRNESSSFLDPATGTLQTSIQTIVDRVIDDELPIVADEFVKWLELQE